mmetsp:Transcript_112086/g.222789  ORF Transcript_112086/g.222789 Transcript_112086/m.222789 type:complete len:222 (-) Transcript_112086:541-1206(-)
MLTTTSPKRPPRMGRTPAISAGPPGTTFMTIIPLRLSSSESTSGANTMPNTGRLTKPFAMMLSTFLATVSIGMARPTPEKVPVPVRMAVFTPTTCPSELSNGPPLLPGLIEASVWITPLIGRPPELSILRETPLMIPRLRLCSKPNGLPKANTFCPTSRLFDCPLDSGAMRVRGADSETSRERAPTRNTATSLAGSAPTIAASNVVLLSAPVALSFIKKVT